MNLISITGAAIWEDYVTRQVDWFGVSIFLFIMWGLTLYALIQRKKEIRELNEKHNKK